MFENMVFSQESVHFTQNLFVKLFRISSQYTSIVCRLCDFPFFIPDMCLPCFFPLVLLKVYQVHQTLQRSNFYFIKLPYCTFCFTTFTLFSLDLISFWRWIFRSLIFLFLFLFSKYTYLQPYSSLREWLYLNLEIFDIQYRHNPSVQYFSNFCCSFFYNV